MKDFGNTQRNPKRILKRMKKLKWNTKNILGNADTRTITALEIAEIGE